jgi:hypothetical protein
MAERLEDRLALSPVGQAADGVVAIPQVPPCRQEFTEGQPGAAAGWEYYSSGDGRIEVVAGQLRADDQRKDAAYSLNEAILHVDLRNVESADLTLDHQNAGDEVHRFRATAFEGHANADLIAASLDGQHWVKVTDLTKSFLAATFTLDAALQQAAVAAGTTDRSHVRIKIQQYDDGVWGNDGRGFDNVQVNRHLRPEIEIRGRDVAIADGDVLPSLSDGTDFGSVASSLSRVSSFTVWNRGVDPLTLNGNPAVGLTGMNAASFRLIQPPTAVVNPGQSTTFTLEFTPTAAATFRAIVAVQCNDADEATYNFAVVGTGLVVPPVENAAPAPGHRVKVVAPEYAGTNVYHTLYLPTDWQPGRLYPVIVEFPPNASRAARTDGTVDDTVRGFYQSAGRGFIWTTMPFINYTTNPYSNARYYWGSGNTVDPYGEQLAAGYAKQNLIRILEGYGGDPARVFATGFSRGSIATSMVGLQDAALADIWLGFLPHSGYDRNRERVAQVAGRASFITAGGRDPMAGQSVSAWQYLTGLGFPAEYRALPNVGHSDAWIQDNASPASLAIRQEMRNWIADVIADHPGTHSICGTVTDAAGKPLSDVRIQSGDTHWTYTDANGRYELAGLINGQRRLSATFRGATVWADVFLSGSDVHGKDFRLASTPSPPRFTEGAVANGLAEAAAGDQKSGPGLTVVAVTGTAHDEPAHAVWGAAVATGLPQPSRASQAGCALRATARRGELDDLLPELGDLLPDIAAEVAQLRVEPPAQTRAVLTGSDLGL